MGTQLNKTQVRRYLRHILLKDVGALGQEKLINAKVLCIGAGGLGCPALLYLTAAGVGTLGIAEGDRVDETNLQRQILHFTKDVGRPKLESAKEKLMEINPDLKIEKYPFFLKADSIRAIVRNYDFVIDGTDSLAAKFLINDACILENIPFSHAGILRFEGQLMTVLPKVSRCVRCLFKKPPPPGSAPSCAEVGVLGVMAGSVGILQATEAIKFILGKGQLLTDRLLVYDALAMRFREIKGKRNPQCEVCGDHPTLNEVQDFPEESCILKD